MQHRPRTRRWRRRATRRASTAWPASIPARTSICSRSCRSRNFSVDDEQSLGLDRSRFRHRIRADRRQQRHRVLRSLDAGSAALSRQAADDCRPGSSIWRDVRVYQNHAFVVSDANPGHGMQVFDLTRLRDVTSPQTFTEDGHYSGFGSSHTISINETTGFASVAGADIICPGDSNHGGLQILDIHDPTSPSSRAASTMRAIRTNRSATSMPAQTPSTPAATSASIRTDRAVASRSSTSPTRPRCTRCHRRPTTAARTRTRAGSPRISSFFCSTMSSTRKTPATTRAHTSSTCPISMRPCWSAFTSIR